MDVQYLTNNFMLIACHSIFNIINYLKCIIKINFSFFNVANRNFLIMYVTCIFFLLESSALN